MKNSLGKRNLARLGLVCAALLALAVLSVARTPTTSVNIVNNSTREIRNVYLSHVDADDWSADLLGNATIGEGQSYALDNLACDGQQIKVIAEDSDGCFVSEVVNCGQSGSWTITDDTARDCGF